MNIFRVPDYGNYFSTEKLFEKLRKLSGKVLALVLVRAFLLYELLRKHDTPLPVRAAIVATLGYLVCPFDAIPDVLPGGFTDDVALMAGLIASIDYLISDEVRCKAKERAASFPGVREKGGGENDPF